MSVGYFIEDRVTRFALLRRAHTKLRDRLKGLSLFKRKVTWTARGAGAPSGVVPSYRCSFR